MYDIFILLLLFQLKHFLCDYLLQIHYMLGKMNRTGWVKPLAAHAAVHALFTCYIASIWLLNSYLIFVLAAIDFIVHFTVDRIKASPDFGGRFNPSQPYFWWALGADQMAHHLTHYVFIYTIISI